VVLLPDASYYWWVGTVFGSVTCLLSVGLSSSQKWSSLFQEVESSNLACSYSAIRYLHIYRAPCKIWLLGGMTQ